MLDFDLAELYETETRLLKRAVRRNLDRFPKDFMFQLTKQEWQELIPIWDNLSENVKYSPTTPFAFTEQGVAMHIEKQESYGHEYRHYESICLHQTICFDS